MTVPPIALTRSGAKVHLLAPRPDSINIFDIGEHLARICRYNGAPEIPFSVAQHSVELAREMHAASGALAAVYGMLHDAHEFALGDITEPAATAIEFHFAGIRTVLETLRADLDRAIHEALDLDWPPPEDVQRLLSFTHARLVATELRDVMHGCDAEVFAMRRAGFMPLTRRLRPHANHIVAADNWLEMLRRYTALAGLPTLAI